MRSTGAGDAKTAVGLAFWVWRFWQKRGHLYEARRRLDVMAVAPWSRDDPVLRARLTATKLAWLLDAPEELFTTTVLDQARQLAHGKAVHVIGVVVNRVDTARA